jgi:dipeptidyl aminopeptidase/acylaminoacyl peptidase
MTYFDKVKQPLLLIQGTKDEIIPLESHAIISSAIKPSGNEYYQLVLLENANHSMYFVGESDFPYWATLHIDYLITMSAWIEEVLED